MNKFKQKLILLSKCLLIFLVILLLNCNNEKKNEQIIRNITPAEADSLIRVNENNPNFVIIDVCTPEEYSEEHLKDAVNLNFYSSDFIDNLKKLDKNKTYLVYCGIEKRSQKSVDIMKELGFKRVYNLLGGITHWREEEFPVYKN